MLIDDIALTMHPEVGCRTVIHLLEHFGSAEGVYAATEKELCREVGLKASVVRSILNRETHLKAQQELEFIARRRLKVLTSDSPAYPGRLLECGDYPHVLYVSGNLDFNVGHWLSVVGTRKVTPYGSRICETLIGELARIVPDLVIVSGLAYGVDVAAHRAALKYGVPTVGVLGHPITRIYPPEHTDTARRMVAQGGAVLSEFASGDRPLRAGFVQRNRLIAGLSEGTLVVESAARGGSLITADMADGYHRSLMAVPGRIGDTYSEGPNFLIRTLKAQMVCSAQEIVEWMNWEERAAEQREPSAGSGVPGIVSSSEKIGEAEVPKITPGVNPAEGAYGYERTDAGSQFSMPSPGSVSEKNPDKESPQIQRILSESSMPEDKPSVASSGERVGMSAELSDSSTDEDLSSAAQRVLALIDAEVPIGLDELSLKAPFPVADLALLLLDLEFRGRICCLPGNRYLKY